MARSVAVGQEYAYRAAVVVQGWNGKPFTRYEGIYNKRAAARSRVSFWRNYDRAGFVDGWVEQSGRITWVRLDDQGEAVPVPVVPRERYVVATWPWEQGLVVYIHGVGTTQTHVDYPEDSAESMARDYIACVKEVPQDSFDLVVFSRTELLALGADVEDAYESTRDDVS